MNIKFDKAQLIFKNVMFFHMYCILHVSRILCSTINNKKALIEILLRMYSSSVFYITPLTNGHLKFLQKVNPARSYIWPSELWCRIVTCLDNKD